jgi:hypothetical protein
MGEQPAWKASTPAQRKEPSGWPIVAVVLLFLAFIVSGLGERVVADRDASGADLFHVCWWSSVVVIAYAAVVLRVWWYYRRVRTVGGHLALFVLAVAVPVAFLMRMQNSVLVDDGHFEWEGSNTAGNIRFADVKEVSYRSRTAVLGADRVGEVRVMLKNGRTEVPLVGGLMEHAGPEILRRAEQAGVPVRQIPARPPN